MRKIVFLLIGSLLFGGWREGNLTQIEEIIKVYSQRLNCLEDYSALSCIQKFPLDPKSDTLAKTFNMSFPKSYYRAILKRNIQKLQEQKLCFGKAVNLQEAQSCLTP